MQAWSLVDILLGFVVELLFEVVADVPAIFVSFVQVVFEVGRRVFVCVLVEV